jgi:hypothetical protein
MLEHTPTEERKRVLNECLRCRGLIVGSYAHVEFLLADLCFKSWRLPSYHSLPKRFPYKGATREQAVSAILSVKDGPLFEFGSAAAPFLKQWRNSERDRNMLAHGLMTIEWTTSGSIFVRGQMLKPISEKRFALVKVRWSLSTLQAKAGQATKCSQGWMRICHAMHSKLGWIRSDGVPVGLLKDEQSTLPSRGP